MIDIGILHSGKDLKQDFYHNKCDKYDYLAAVGCGALAGLVDVFLVGSPLDSNFNTWTDTKVDKTVMGFAKLQGWSPRTGQEGNVKSAIGFLEKKFPVNYDQRHSGDVGGLLNMSTKNHHMKSLAHSPSIIGLFFSILNQFMSTSSFLSDGKLITVRTETFELQGHDFISKLFCGISNWLGHIMSDVAGSSGASGRGSGIVIPFYELFGICNFGRFQVGEHRNTLSVVATKVFEQGYDARFGLTMALPVILCDLSIKLIWALKRYFYHKRPLSECIPSARHDDLRLMLIVGEGTLCLIDAMDAAIRSGGNLVNFLLRLNLIAWFRLIVLVLKEVYIRVGLSSPLQKQLQSYMITNEELQLYIRKLERIDIDLFKEETKMYNDLIDIFDQADDAEKLNVLLKTKLKKIGLALPYKGNFDDFMQDKSLCLEFD